MLAEEISRQPSTNSVMWLLVVTPNAELERKGPEQREMQTV